MGYTIYRDYPDGKFAVVSTEPSSDFDQFSKEIEAIKCFSQAPTRAEAFYQGLIEGIKSANFTNPYAQNLLVIIGDSGNHIEDSLSLEDVKAELEGKKITLFGLQTTNGAHASYLDFNQDILQLASVTSSSGKWVEESESKFTFKSSNSEEIAAWETESSIYVGNAKEKPTDPVQMSDDVAHAIRKLNDKRRNVSEQFFRAVDDGKKLPQISGVTTKIGRSRLRQRATSTHNPNQTSLRHLSRMSFFWKRNTPNSNPPSICLLQRDLRRALPMNSQNIYSKL